jgi:predicted RNase H-like HicB family nuclease
MAKVLNFRVIIEQDEDGVFIASAPAIPGCHTQGNSYEEVIKNIKEAIEVCLEVAKEDKKYYQKIDWSGTDDGKSRFLGVTEVPVKFGFSS